MVEVFVLYKKVTFSTTLSINAIIWYIMSKKILQRGIMMPVYNKLVRDKIPQIIEASGKKFSTKILSDKAYKIEAKKKLQEELDEYIEAKSDENALEELADMLELIHALAKVHGSSIDEVEQIRAKKSEKRGGFEEKIFLIEVED